ncbi:MAG: biopolymer transporter ExbD [Opitutales bacterium]|nr:biopolymer transporter ExbD [Opitutales bacterium]MCH8540327.1 biopolymer transporter ExbD [Opitutales bacterium]
MARTFKRSERLDALAEPNITPLIDLAFSLLIIFMITTPLLEQTIPLELPIEDPREDAQRSAEVQFQAVGVEGGSYFWGDQRIDRAEMRERLVELRDREDGTVLNVRASGLASYQEVVDLLSLIQEVGLRRISLDTQVGLE